jgi:hypothetical protein
VKSDNQPIRKTHPVASKFIDGFKPSEQGFHFENAFDDAPVLTISVPAIGDIPVGNAGGGLCGGMVFAALDFFNQGQLPPLDTTAPKPGTPLFEYIAHRLLDSFNGVAGINKYLEWMRFPADSHLFGILKTISWHTLHDEWPSIQTDLNNGRPSPLGLILIESVNPLDVGKNHQVLAYGYDLNEESGDLQVFIYDPNWPGRDDVTLSLNVADRANPSPVTYSVDPAGRGFFRTKYTSSVPPAPAPN